MFYIMQTHINGMLWRGLLRYQRETGAYRASSGHRRRTLTRSRKQPADVQTHSSRQLLNSPRSLGFRSSTASIPHTLYEAVNLSKMVERIPCDNSTFTKAACGQWASLYQCVCVGRVYLACSEAFDDGSGYVRTNHEEGHSSQPKNISGTIEILGWDGERWERVFGTSGPKYTAHFDLSLKPLTAGTRPFGKVMETSLELSL